MINGANCHVCITSEIIYHTQPHLAKTEMTSAPKTMPRLQNVCTELCVNAKYAHISKTQNAITNSYSKNPQLVAHTHTLIHSHTQTHTHTSISDVIRHLAYGFNSC